MIYDDIRQLMGNTPHVLIKCQEFPKIRIYMKLEGVNPTGSIKDRAAIYLIREKLEQKQLRPGMILLDASSGNMACAIAYYGRLMGYATTSVVNSKLTQDKRKFLQYFGATLHQVGDFTIEGNIFCREIVEREGPDKYCFLDQLHNWSNPRAHYETTGPEILSDFPNISVVVGSLGSGGAMFGTGQFLKQEDPNIKVVAVQSAAGTRLPGTGSFDDGDYITPFIRKGIDDSIFDSVIKINEADAIRRTIQAREQGIFAGLQTGGVLHAALEALRTLDINGDVVILSGDAGWKNMDRLLQI